MTARHERAPSANCRKWQAQLLRLWGIWSSRRIRRTTLVAALACLVAAVTPAVIKLAGAPANAQDQVLGACSPTTIFNVAGSQQTGANVGAAAGGLYALNVGSGLNTFLARFSSGSTPINGLGVAADLTATPPTVTDAYAVAQNASSGGQQIYTITNAGATSQTTNAPNTGVTLVMGAVDPANGIYYYAGYSTPTPPTGPVLQIWGYDPADNTPLGRLGNVSFAGTPYTTGDLAFDKSGNLYILAGTNSTTAANSAQSRRVDADVIPSAPVTTPPTLPSTTLATKEAPQGQGFYNGIAFAANGILYAQYATSGTQNAVGTITGQSTATLVPLNASTAAPVAPFSITQTGTPGGNSVLTDLAGCSLPGTLTVQKALPNGRAVDTDQFTMSVTGGGLSQGNTATTTGPGTPPPPGIQVPRVGPLLAVPSTTYTISEVLAQGNTTSINAYTSALSCVNTNTNTTIDTSPVAGSPPGTSFTLVFPGPVGVAGANVVCTFTNSPAPPTLTLTKALGGTGRINADDQFTVQIRTGSPEGPIEGDTTHATSTGTGTTVDEGSGTTTLSPATAGTEYFLTEEGVGETNLGAYTQIIQCTDLNGVQTTGLPNEEFHESASVTPVPGAAISCILTNTPAGGANGENGKELGSARISDTDQFTVEIRPGSPIATPLPPEGILNPTTSGGGATVDPGTGTTGFVPLTVGTTYFLTESAAGTTNLALETTTVTCVDFAGLQKGLPTDVPASDNPHFTLMHTGSLIDCEEENVAHQPLLILEKALGSPRVNAGDQFTMQILAADQTTVVGETDDATTQGTGNVVTSGTGITTLFPATAGETFYVNEIPAAGTPTNLQQYSAEITCTDFNGVQTDLPTDVPFGGPFQLMPQLGASITCIITNTAVPPGLILNKALGSARFASTDQFTMQITDPTGAVVGTTANATTTGTGSTVDLGSGVTELASATAGTTYTLSEVGAGTPPANLANYAATISCLDSEGLQPNLPVNAPFAGSITITPVGAASITCTVTNTAEQFVVPVTG